MVTPMGFRIQDQQPDRRLPVYRKSGTFGLHYTPLRVSACSE
jgi:hypothetical protein